MPGTSPGMMGWSSGLYPWVTACFCDSRKPAMAACFSAKREIERVWQRRGEVLRDRRRESHTIDSLGPVT